MADSKIFAGPRVRRIRNKLDLTQTAMAGELGISPSYLNLIERNQRPLTAQLVLKLVATYKIDVEELQPSGDTGSVSALREVFSDPLLQGELPGQSELLELSDGAPNAAIGIVKLYRAYCEQQERLSDLSRLLGEASPVLNEETQRLPADTVRSVFETIPWCFPALETAAARIVDALGAKPAKMESLLNLLRSAHGISAQVLPVEVMPVWRKRFDRHSQRLFISERLPLADRALLLAEELVVLRESRALDEEIDLLKIRGDEARRLARAELARYAALAVLMPYERFLRTAERVFYDPVVLATRFETGFSQIAQRLSSLANRSGGNRAGLPFFMFEVDQAGNVLRRLGTKGFPRAGFGGDCPKLAVHAAFAKPGELLAERVITPQKQVFLTLSCTVEGVRAGAGERPRRTAILLGLEDEEASNRVKALQDKVAAAARAAGEAGETGLGTKIAHARLLADVAQVSPVAIGTSCRLCERQDCVARAAPPLTRPLGLDDLTQGFGAHGLT